VTTVLVRGFPAAAFGTNCWVVAPAPGEQCVVIDPGIGVEAELELLLGEYRLQPVAVLITHGHLDHTFSVTPVCGAKDVPAYIHPADRELLADPVKGLSAESRQLFGGRLEWSEPSDVRLLESSLSIAGIDFTVDLAPGHTPGSVVFESEQTMFSGDVLFAGSIGRTDLPGGSWEQMQDSLARVILPRDDEVVVHCGHGPSTTIGQERRTNPFLQQLASAPPARGL
jgi:glyoxylase-like metal-dependent hydrolase (beta-lactamase superfamily II)